MLEQDWDARFLTIAYASLTVGTDAIRGSLACAGHPPPVRIPANGPAEPLDTGGDIVGVWDDIRLKTAEFELTRGESLVLFTDGVTDQGPVTEETRDPATALDGRRPDAGADELAEIVDHLAHAGGPPRDDIAIVAVRFVGAGDLVTAGPAEGDAGTSDQEESEASELSGGEPGVTDANPGGAGEAEATAAPGAALAAPSLA